MPTIMWNQRSSRFTHSPRKTSISDLPGRRRAGNGACEDLASPHAYCAPLPAVGAVRWRATARHGGACPQQVRPAPLPALPSFSSLPRQLVVDPLDEIVHAEDLPVIEIGAAFALDLLTVLPEHRAL